MRDQSQRGRAGFFITLTVILIEAVLQLIAGAVIPDPLSTRVYDPEVGWMFTGHTVMRSAEYGSYEVRFNSRGMRGPEVDGPVPVMILGDSVTSAPDVPEEYTFTAQLGAANAGTAGYTTRQSARHYARDLQDLQPDLLVFVLTPHEFAVPEPPTAWGDLVFGLMSLKEREGGVRLARWITGTSYGGPDQNPRFARAVQTPPSAEAWESWWFGVQQVHALRGARPLIVVYMPPAAQIRAYQAGERDFWINERIRRACDAEGIECIDLTAVIAQYDVGVMYGDHLHLSIAGHAVVANALADRLSPICTR